MKKQTKILIAILSICITNWAISQNINHSNLIDSNSAIQKDLSDLFKKKSKQNIIDSINPIQPKKYHLSIVPAVGYTLQTGFAGIISGNIAYAADTFSSTKLSSISTSVTYSQYSQTIIPLVADIWTAGNKLNIISDNRFIAYPSDIYGLGGRTDPNKGLTINFSGIKLHETIVKQITKNLYAGLGIYFDKFWDIKALDSLRRRDSTRFSRELGTEETSTGIAFKLLYDSRINQINATNGWYGNIVYRPNFKFLGSDKNWQYLLIDIRKYVQFPRNSKNVLCFWNLNWLTLGGTPPYLLLPSTGWDDQYNTGRGYIQGRFRGNNMNYLETEYRYNITRNGLIGGVLFVNAERFSGEISNQFKTISPGYGLGLRLKLNKFSGTNLCVDYGFGKNGSRGFFVNLGEVF